MSEEHSSLLRFSLEESVWFQRGQEVEELYSISLEPNVSAHQIEQYIILKGTLDLMGEYKPAEENEQLETEDPLRRYVSIIEQRENHLYEFHQQFPVDITIPAERVRDIEELNVGVHTFDYKLPEKGTLQITADLWIGGVYENLAEEPEQGTATREETSNFQKDYSVLNQEEHVPSMWNDANEETEESAEEITIQADYQKFEEEQIEEPIYRVNSEEDDENESYEETGSPDIQFNTHPPSFFENTEEQNDGFYLEMNLSPRFHQQQSNEHEIESDVSSIQAQEYVPDPAEPDLLLNMENQASFNQSFSIPHNARFEEGPPELMDVTSYHEKEDSSEYESVQLEMDEPVEEVELIESYRSKPREEFIPNQYSEKQYQSTESKRDNVKEEQVEGKSKSLLYDLFTEEEESQQIKVRVCIVQNGENIDVLADRYKTSVQQIARINELELTDDLKAGQVIYIPEAATSYK